MYQNPLNQRFGGGADSTHLDPFVLVMLLITIFLTFVLPRRYVIVPILLTAILAPDGQQYYLAGAHLYIGRLLIFFGWVRIFVRRKSEDGLLPGGWTAVDKIYIAWAVFRAIATYLEFLEPGAAFNQVAFLTDSLGGFFLCRHFIRDQEDIVRVLKTFVAMVALLALTMTNEHFNAVNVFGYIGGILTPFVRDGAIRSQGPFTGPIPAGTFGATLLCLFFWLKQTGKATAWAVVGVFSALVMVYMSASSTPLMTVPAGLLAISFWPLRKNMRAVRWVLVAFLVIVHLSMKAPVWMLINHIDLVGGNSSYHRAMLIDGFITHFNEWWLIGIQSTAGWGWDMWDQANQFVQEGESGGILTFICFILILSRCFARLGNARRMVEGDREQEWGFWLLGAAMFSQIVSFFGISFSDQSIYGWYPLLAIIVASTAPLLEPSEEAELEPEPEEDSELLDSPVPHPIASQS
jgi:hypothetical protein